MNEDETLAAISVIFASAVLAGSMALCVQTMGSLFSGLLLWWVGFNVAFVALMVWTADKRRERD